MGIIAPSKTITYRRIKREIEYWVRQNSNVFSDFERWYCGITNDPNKRYSHHKHKNQEELYFFNFWDAKSLRIAMALETSFHSSGMKDTDLLGNVKYNSIYIYIYKKHPTIADRLFG